MCMIEITVSQQSASSLSGMWLVMMAMMPMKVIDDSIVWIAEIEEHSVAEEESGWVFLCWHPRTRVRSSPPHKLLFLPLLLQLQAVLRLFLSRHCCQHFGLWH
mmetsp:Transcript_18120/g.35036  ORF Transcript_18120/g.35036 Transcript_18120/m.35036 type:complete len:103 (-) Transcript_18120:207-515(-)